MLTTALVRLWVAQLSLFRKLFMQLLKEAAPELLRVRVRVDSVPLDLTMASMRSTTPDSSMITTPGSTPGSTLNTSTLCSIRPEPSPLQPRTQSFLARLDEEAADAPISFQARIGTARNTGGDSFNDSLENLQRQARANIQLVQTQQTEWE